MRARSIFLSVIYLQKLKDKTGIAWELVVKEEKTF